MTKVTIQHACGHASVHGLSGSTQDRSLRQAWLTKQPCADCWRAAQRSKAEAAREAASLPDLSGEEQEIAWASVIRMKVIAHNQVFYQRLLDEDPYAEDPELRDLVFETARAALDALGNETRAPWWLEHRFDMLDYVKQRVVHAIAPILQSRDE